MVAVSTLRCWHCTLLLCFVAGVFITVLMKFELSLLFQGLDVSLKKSIKMSNKWKFKTTKLPEKHAFWIWISATCAIKCFAILRCGLLACYNSNSIPAMLVVIQHQVCMIQTRGCLQQQFWSVTNMLTLLYSISAIVLEWLLSQTSTLLACTHHFKFWLEYLTL